MDANKATFLFGSVPEHTDLDDPDERAGLLQAAHGVDDDGGELRSLLQGIVAEQVLDDDPPQVWEAAQRLLADGMGSTVVLTQLVVAFTPVLLDAVRGDRDLDADAYAARLERLPLPATEQVIETLLHLARTRGPLEAAELDRLAAERLGLSIDDPVIEDIFDQADEWLIDAGPLALLAGDIMVHVEAITADIVLSHRLSDPERGSGLLAVDVDLAGFQRRTELRLPDGAELSPVVDDDVQVWVGPPGWLADYPAAAMLGVRVDPDGVVRLTHLDPEPTATDGQVELVRAVYDEHVSEPGLPVSAKDLILGVLVRDPAAFAQPVPPLSDLADAAGLERRRSYFAHDASSWENEELAQQLFRVMDRLDDQRQVQGAMTALTLLQHDVLDAADAREALAELYDPLMLEVVPDELLGLDDDPERVEALTRVAERLVAVARRPEERAVAHWLAALAAERSGNVLAAESHLRSAVRADPGWSCAEDRLAWYEADRGDAAAALARWRALGVPEDAEDVRSVAPFAAAAQPALGRNQPCWCGSGRKFKTCHLGRPATAALPDRVGWLSRKAVGYLERRGGTPRLDVMEYAGARALDPDDEESLAQALDDPLVLDVLLQEGGWFERFLAERGPLLPADEALLAEAWTLVDRTVYEVLDVTAGVGLRVRDLRTGDQLDVRERTASQQAHAGQLLCGRAVPDGESNQFIGGLFGVSPGREAGLLDLLDSGDGLDLLEYVAALNQPPTLVSPEGDLLLDCNAVVAVSDAVTARAELDRRYQREDDGWAKVLPIAAGGIRHLATLGLDGARISVSSMTEQRLDDVLAELRQALPGARVVEDERRPIPLGTPVQRSAAPLPPPLPPEAMNDMLDQLERRWCAESVPALAGLTPRQAAEDPTRQAELERLIDSFPTIDPSTGMFGLRPERLRSLLGLDPR